MKSLGSIFRFVLNINNLIRELFFSISSFRKILFFYWEVKVLSILVCFLIRCFI